MIEVEITIDSLPDEVQVTTLTRNFASGSSLIVGRSRRAQWVIKDPRLSSTHFEIIADDSSCLLRDLQSTNGTQVNNQAGNEFVLSDGDLISAGRLTFEIAIRSEAGGESGRAEDINQYGTPSSDSLPYSAARNVTSETRVFTGVELCTIESARGDEKLSFQPVTTVTVGSSSLADLTIDDDSLADRHFQIQLTEKDCVVKSLTNSLPIQINGQPMHSGRVYDHDRVSAGQSEFTIALLGPDEMIKRPEQDVIGTQKIRLPNEGLAVQAALPVIATVGIVGAVTGAIAIRGMMEKLSPPDLMDRLAKGRKVYLLVDFSRLGDPGTGYEKNRLSEGDAGTVGAYLLPIKNRKRLEEWLEQIWGADCGFFLFSKLDFDELRQFLKEIKLGETTMCDLCWPSVMQIILPNGNRKSITKLFDKVDYIVSETDDAEEWSIHCNDRRRNQLDELKLKVEMQQDDNESEKNDA